MTRPPDPARLPPAALRQHPALNPSPTRVAILILKLLVVLAALFLFLRWFEHQQVYRPTVDFQAFRVPGHAVPEDVFLTTVDGIRLHAWYFRAPANAARAGQALCHFHGNAGNLAGRGAMFEALLRTGMNVLAIDYRGYGRSEGRPSEAGTYRDAEAAHQWLLDQGFAPASIVVHGESLGGGIASHLASARPVGALILQSTYTSIADIGSEMFPFLPVRLVGGIRYPTLSRLPSLRVPVLVMHSPSDEIIPFAHGQRNFAAAKEPKMFWELRTGHNRYLDDGGQRLIEGIASFLDHHLPPAPRSPG